MRGDIKVAAVSLPAIGGEPWRNCARISELSLFLSNQGAKLICFPEACITGYSVREKEAMAWAISSDSLFLEELRKLSQQLEVTLLVGFMEKDPGGDLFITQVALCANGGEVSYRKTHLSPQEALVFKAGSSSCTFDAEAVIGGIALCYEAHFPEYLAALALKGVELLCFPSASPGESPDEKLGRWLRFMPARAYDNGSFVIACNQGGENGSGLRFPAVALILDPKGRVLASDKGEREALAMATLKAQEVNRIKAHPLANFLIHRRPELYCPMLSTHPESPPHETDPVEGRGLTARKGIQSNP